MSPHRDNKSREQPGFGVRLVVVLVGLVVIATGAYMAVTGKWAFEDMAHAEGLPARIVGGVVAAIGAIGLVRAFRRWAKT
jgi:hypothetical protein